jgi:hypothetical protein
MALGVKNGSDRQRHWQEDYLSSFSNPFSERPGPFVLYTEVDATLFHLWRSHESRFCFWSKTLLNLSGIQSIICVMREVIVVIRSTSITTLQSFCHVRLPALDARYLTFA